MHIAMLISTPFPPEEGIGNYAYNLSKNLMKRGHKITLITRGSYKRKIDFFEGMRVIYAPFLPIYPFHVNLHSYFVNNLFKSLEDEFDILHVHTPLSPVIKTSIPIVSTIHTSVIEDIKHIESIDFKSVGTKITTKFVSYPLVSRLIASSDVVTTVSNSVKHELKKYYNCDGAIVVRNGVDEEIFKPAKQKKEENYILFVGRLSYRKGLFDLLESAKRICQDYDVNFLLVGKGELEGVIKKKINKYKLEDRVRLLGHVKREKLIALYQNAMIFSLPSHYEGLPTVLLEAMSCESPVVSTSASGSKDVIEHNKNGILISPKSPGEMTEALAKLIAESDLRKRLGKNARKTIESKYTWDVITNIFEKCYETAR